jgi:hypothetical protein
MNVEGIISLDSVDYMLQITYAVEKTLQKMKTIATIPVNVVTTNSQ